MFYSLKIWIPVLLAAMMILAGCNDDAFREPLPGANGEQAGNMFICFRLKLNGDGVAGMEAPARAEETIPADRTPGTDSENAINSLALLVYDSESGEMINYVYLERAPIDILSIDAGMTVPILAKAGQGMNIYAVVNPTANMRRHIFDTRQSAAGLAITAEYDEYRDVINEFVPGSDGHQSVLESSATGGIPMTGIFRMEGHTDNLIITTAENANIDNPLIVSADVSRIVAKMHVLAASETHTLSDGSTVEYVKTEDKTSRVREASSESYANWIGWIRLSDVRYIPNGMNKSTYIFPHEGSETGKLADLNMDLTKYVNETDARFDSYLYGNDFVFYNGMNLHGVNTASGDSFGRAEAFSRERLDLTGGTDDPNRYTRGMYCLENYFDVPTANATFYANYASVIPAVTHVSIAARLTPRNIVVGKDYATDMDAFVDAFEKNPDLFRSTYGLTPDDFTADDAMRWKSGIKERYFGTTTLPETYRDDFRIVRVQNEADAIDLVNWSLMANKIWSSDESDFAEGKYSAATFYVYDTKYDPAGTTDTWTQRFLYLTAGAVINATDKNMRLKTYSVPHVGGWGYYYTYLDELGQNTAGGVTPYTSSQVTRNTYYLISVDNFGVPGGSITRPEYIRVNTESVGWVYEGRGDINLH